MVRMQDVADHANVSIATVSFVVNGTKQVSPATRLRVESAMTELGFTRNALARALATKRSRIIALLFPALDARLNPTVLEFVHAAAKAAAERDHHLVVWPVANDPVALREYLDGGLVDGVLAMEVQIEDPRVPVLEAAKVPYVLIGRTGDPDASGFADIDFEASTTDALERLTALGHRSIALMLEPLSELGGAGYAPPLRTEATYRAFARAHGEVPIIVRAERNPISGSDAIPGLLAAMPQVTAVLVLNAEAAPGAVRGLRAAGRSVPAQVSVLGLAMSQATAAFSDPMLDHLAAPGLALGRAAADALIDRLEDPATPPIHTLLPCVYVAGGTVGVAPGRA